MRADSGSPIALLSHWAIAIFAISLPRSSEAFVVSLTTKARSKIATASKDKRRSAYLLPDTECRKQSSYLLNSLYDSESSIGSIDELEERIAAMKVVELREELKSKGLPIKGLKKVLQCRLLDFYQAGRKDFMELSNSKVDSGSNANEEDEDVQESEKGKEVDDDSEPGVLVVNDQDDETLILSKRKWKKKTYLLLEDVRKIVHSNDVAIRQRGPKKARDAVKRMQRWISPSYSESAFSISLEDDSTALDYEDSKEKETTISMGSDSTIEFRMYQQSSLLRAYNLWIHAIAKSGIDNAGHMAEQVLQEMQQNASNGGPTPNEITIASVMDAHAHSATASSSKNGAKAAEKFLFTLLEKHDTDVDTDEPWSQDNESILRDSLVVTCDTMLNALAREGTVESAERVQMIVFRLEEYQRQREEKFKKSRLKNGGQHLWERKETTKESISLKRPISYATVMNAWANVGSTLAAEQAEATLEALMQKAKAEKSHNRNSDNENSKLVQIRPDTIVFNSVIQCWANSGDIRAGEKSLQLLEQMKRLAGISSENNDDKHDKIYFDTHPDIITYNTVLSAWSRCGKKNAAPQAEKIVKELIIEQQQETDFENVAKTPIVANRITFNTVLDAWSRSRLPGAAGRAEKLLKYMIQSDNIEIKPDIYSFTCVMNAWAKSKEEPHKAFHTRQLLDQLIETHQKALQNSDRRKARALQPTAIPYNTVLNACAFSALKTSQDEQREAIKIAVDTYKDMSSLESRSGQKGNQRMVFRDTVTYGLMLKAIANLMPKGKIRNQMAIQIFQECCNDGLVGFLVWNEVRRAVPCKLLQESFRFPKKCGSLKVDDLPKAWRANCREGSRTRRQREQNMTKDNSKKHKKKDPSKNQQKDTAFIIERSFATGKDM